MTGDWRLPDNRSGAAVWPSDRWPEYVGAAVGIVTLVGLILLLGRRGYDDPYITFRYAHNLLSGHGLVYNVGQRTLSTTAPLYAMLLAGLDLVWPAPSGLGASTEIIRVPLGQSLPALSSALSAVAVVVAAAFLFGLSRSRGQRAVGMIAALLLSLSPNLLTTFGAETCFCVMLILGGFYAYDRSRFGLAASALALATMVRPDGLIAAIGLVLVHLIRRRSLPWRPLILYTALVGAWYIGLWIYFGSPVPVTLLTKQQQGQMAVSTRFAAGFLDLVRQQGSQPLYWLQGILALVGLGRVATKARHWTPLLTWTALYFLAYTILGVSRYYWYYAPLVPAFVVLVAEGTVALVRGVARIELPRPLLAGFVGLLLIALLAPLLKGTLWAVWMADPRAEMYREIGQWLESHTAPEASVGALEVGIIGYYAQRPMIDFAGLIQPDVARHLASGTTYQDSAAWAIQTYRPDYVLLPWAAFSDLAESDWFRAGYLPERTFTNRERLWMTLYHRSEN